MKKVGIYTEEQFLSMIKENLYRNPKIQGKNIYKRLIK